MNVFNLSKKQIWNTAVAMYCLLALTSCAATKKEGFQIHHLKVGDEKELPVTLKIPPHWQIQTDAEKKEISLLDSIQGEKTTITAKKLGVEKVGVKLLKAFGRIHIKRYVDDGWVEQHYADDIQFDGNHAIQYTLHKGDNAAIVYTVGKSSYVYIITISAPTAQIASSHDTLKGTIQLGKPSESGKEKIQLSQQQPYIVSSNIFNLQFSQFEYAQEDYEKDASQTLALLDKVVLLEQVCFKYTLLKSESLLYKLDDSSNHILEEVTNLYTHNKEVAGLARCDALRSYLGNRLNLATTKLESILLENPGDIHAKLYLTMIRPYDSAFLEKVFKEAVQEQDDNILTIYLQSKHYLTEGKTNASRDLLKKTLKNHPRNMWLKFAVARNYHNDGKSKEAKRLYKEVLQLYHPFLPARFNLAFLLYKEKKDIEAMKHLEMLKHINLNHPDIHLLQGLLLKNKGKHMDAKHAFEMALSIEPDNYRALYNIGALCATKLNDTTCARQAFDRYVIVAPQSNRHASILSWLNKH